MNGPDVVLACVALTAWFVVALGAARFAYLRLDRKNGDKDRDLNAINAVAFGLLWPVATPMWLIVMFVSRETPRQRAARV